MASEKRLIDVEQAKRATYEEIFWTESEQAVVRNFLAKLPKVDAVEVVHGIWLVDDYDSGDPGYYSAYIEVHCSKCGDELGAESGQYGWSYGDPFPLNYCPNCGAKMDGERKDNA